MNESNWSRAYYAVAAAALFVIPMTTLTAAYAAARIPPLLLGQPLAPVPLFYVQCSVPVYYIVGGTALLLIGVLRIFRQRVVSAILSIAVFIVCVGFQILALWTLQMLALGKLYGQIPK